MNSFMLFKKTISQDLKAKYGKMDQSRLAIKAAEIWNNLPANEKKQYTDYTERCMLEWQAMKFASQPDIIIDLPNLSVGQCDSFLWPNPFEDQPVGYVPFGMNEWEGLFRPVQTTSVPDFSDLFQASNVGVPFPDYAFAIPQIEESYTPVCSESVYQELETLLQESWKSYNQKNFSQNAISQSLFI
jgi:hypothetical protein